MRQYHKSGLLLVLLSAAGYSFLPIFAKVIYRHSTLEALDIMIWRFLFATPAIWLALRALRIPAPGRPLPRGYLLGMGLLFGVAATTAFAALARVPASLYTVVIYTYPAMVALAAAVMGEKLPRSSWAALGLTILGVMLTMPVFSTDWRAVSALGIGFTLLNAVSYAAYILLSHRALRGRGAPVYASAWSISGSLLLALVWIAVRGLQMPSTAAAWAALAGLALICTVLPILTFYLGMQRLGAARAAIISTAEPVLTLGLAALLLSERLSGLQLFGGALVFTSVILLQRRSE